MLKNREFTIRVTKPDDKEDLRSSRTIFEDRVSLVHTVIKDTVKAVFVGVLLYIGADTAREVLVAMAKSRTH